MKDAELTPEQAAELAILAGMSDADIDTSDIPEITELNNPRRGVFAGSPNVKLEPGPAGKSAPESHNQTPSGVDD